jgi:hypothetical protein
MIKLRQITLMAPFVLKRVQNHLQLINVMHQLRF